MQGKVFWVLAHSYPALSLEAFGAAAGVPGISPNDAIEATQYAIWRYADVGYDSEWNFETEDSRTAYWYLVNGANAGSGMTPGDFEVTADITAPSAPQAAGTLVGPFLVTTNQPTVAVAVDPARSVTDAAGNPVDVNAVVNGQKIYLDVRAVASQGQATVTVAAQGSGSTGKIISVPNVAGATPTAEDHAQTIILVAPSTKTTDAQANVTWTAAPVAAQPVIGTSLVDSADGDRVLAWNGGTVVDTVAYQNLTPGTQYTVTGELRKKSDGSGTGITGRVTFTPTAANGSVDVRFVVPAGYAGQSLVAFEQLHLGTVTSGEPVAVHENINEPAQTVAVEAAPVAAQSSAQPTVPVAAAASGKLPSTGGHVPVTIIGAAAVMMTLGAVLLVARRRKKAAR